VCPLIIALVFSAARRSTLKLFLLIESPPKLGPKGAEISRHAVPFPKTPRKPTKIEAHDSEHAPGNCPCAQKQVLTKTQKATFKITKLRKASEGNFFSGNLSSDLLTEQKTLLTLQAARCARGFAGV